MDATIHSLWLSDQAIKERRFGQPPKSKHGDWEAVFPWAALVVFFIETEIHLRLACRQKASPQCLPHTNPGRGAIF
jgi:hypothetical protein